MDQVWTLINLRQEVSTLANLANSISNTRSWSNNWGRLTCCRAKWRSFFPLALLFLRAKRGKGLVAEALFAKDRAKVCLLVKGNQRQYCLRASSPSLICSKITFVRDIFSCQWLHGLLTIRSKWPIKRNNCKTFNLYVSLGLQTSH